MSDFHGANSLKRRFKEFVGLNRAQTKDGRRRWFCLLDSWCDRNYKITAFCLYILYILYTVYIKYVVPQEL